ncbi:ABC transporter permease [Mucilaginibacter paludis]|uniref:Transport permease protein n=1 Tax=Mucilaginibacter paludis DSM 18603 TaxID=714943 RepID=H1Y6U5_9SPHI|nr:ABC transporter permease [Mucilaginibacter paludis]EHQ28352.1 ABC-2 type transporter [Mucilaginibacter paludis DSM 18603]
MNQSYSNTKATLAIARASFRSITRSPSAVVFSLAFPLIFILVFGFIGGGSGGFKVDVGVMNGSDTANNIYRALKKTGGANLIVNQTDAELMQDLEKGRTDALIKIQKNANATPPFTVDVKYTGASREKGQFFRSLLLIPILASANQPKGAVPPPAVAALHESTITGRVYKTIDFILPGQLGFSLLSSGVFGTAFVFLSLRVTLVIKRFFATPVKRYSIVLGEMLARIIFSLVGALFIIGIGHFAFGFTLIHGFVTVLNMLALSVLGLIVFMGFGFVVSGIAKNESSVPPIANIITLPQFLLSGTFFSISAFPGWLQPISKALPLTYLNDAMRKVAFEGAGLFDVWHQILILLVWLIIIYTIAVKTFKWE